MKRAVALVLLLALAVAGWWGGPRALESARVVAAMAADGTPPKLAWGAPAPTRQLVSYRIDGRDHQADLYHPGQPPLAAMLLIPGAAQGGKDDPRLVAMATSLARARFTVMVPDIASFKALTVRPSDRREVADAVLALDGQRGPATGGGPLMVMAISYAVGPALLAALEPDIGRRIDLLVGIGGYYDLTAVITFFTTGQFRDAPGAPWRFRQPNAYGKWVFVRANVPRLVDSGDRALLDAMAARKLADLAAPVDDLSARLGPEGRPVMALLANRDPDAVPALVAALPPAIRADIAALTLAGRDFSRLHPRLLLVHGRDDPIIPVTESQALAAAAPPGRADLTVVDSLMHADLRPAGWHDGWQLYGLVWRLLAARDGIS